MIQIMTSGAVNLIQDEGRHGYMHLGVCTGGAMDSLSLRYANALVGNAPDAAGIEIVLFPFKVKFERDTVFACTGGDGRVELDDQELAPWWRGHAKAGQMLTLHRPNRGLRQYLAVSGGIDIDPVLGARATDLKSGFGGLNGRGLKRLDRLPLGQPHGDTIATGSLGCIPKALPGLLRQLHRGCVTVRVIPAAEFSEFTPDSIKQLFTAPWQVTADANRQGYRLQGEHSLSMTERRELLSHGIVPGTVQVPPAGQPIIQLAEANTCGGYPKIATVIEADLWRLGQVPSGCALRFEHVDITTAVAALREQTDDLQALNDNLPLMANRRRHAARPVS